MASPSGSTSEQVAHIVRQCLEQGGSVEIDGLGEFRPDRQGGFQFLARTNPKIFLAYVAEDVEAAERLYGDFVARGLDAWMDRKRLLPGQNWPRAIEAAIESSDFFVACFSGNSVRKKGGFQSELRYALDCARQVPLDEIYIVPVRLDDCAVQRIIQHELQYIDLFPDWDAGMDRLRTMLRRELEHRRPAPALPPPELT